MAHAHAVERSPLMAERDAWLRIRQENEVAGGRARPSHTNLPVVNGACVQQHSACDGCFESRQLTTLRRLAGPRRKNA
jgi:hypothetical protein